MVWDVLRATIAFITTNIDDLFVLMLLFVEKPRAWRETVAGQYLGFTVLVLLSLPGFWLGQLPIKPWIGILGLIPIALGIKAWFAKDDNESDELLSIKPSKRSNRVAKYISPRLVAIAGLTIANGGDNIAIYTALFSNLELQSLWITLGVWTIALFIWCTFARWLTQQESIQKQIEKYQAVGVPIVLCLLGIYIIIAALN